MKAARPIPTGGTKGKKNTCMSNERVWRVQAAFIIFVIVAGVLLHFFHIGYPQQPVSDEAHFATYAADYARGTPHLDIHPPLGKILYSFALYFYPYERYENARFGKLENDSEGMEYYSIPQLYEAFPYVALRGLSAFFGIILPVVVFFFVKRLFPGGVIAPYASSFFVLFENSLLVDTRLILMNGMFLAFGFAALLALVKYRNCPWIGGILFGFALGIKFTAIIFAGASAMVIALGEGEKKIKHLILFFVTAFTVLTGIYLLNNAFIHPSERIEYYSRFISWVPAGLPSSFDHKSEFMRYVGFSFKAFIFEVNAAVSGYTTAAAASDGQSSWYEWPFMRNPLLYYSTVSGKSIMVAGNPVVWIFAVCSIALAAVKLFRTRKNWRENKAVLILFSGYVFSFLPFIVFVRRTTFLYHYFPALLFSILLSAVFADELVRAAPPPRQRAMLFVMCILIVGGFLSVASITYGI